MTATHAAPELVVLPRERGYESATRQPLAWSRATTGMAPIALIAADVVALAIAVGIIYVIRTQFWGPSAFLWVQWASGAIWFAFRASMGLYPSYGSAPAEELRREARSTFAVALTHLGMLLMLTEIDAPGLFGVLAWLVVLPLSFMLRSVAKTLLISRRLYGEPLVVVGTGEKAARAIREMRGNAELGYIPVAVFGDRPPSRRFDIEGVPIVGSIQSAESWRSPYPVKRAMLALSRKEADAVRLKQVFQLVAPRYPHIQIFPDLDGGPSLWVCARPVGAYLTLETYHARFRPIDQLMKRSFDLLIGVPALLLALPLIAVGSIAAFVVSRGAPLFSQVREGRSGKPVRIWKIRTMIPDAEARLAEYLATNDAARFEYQRTLKLRRDPRVLPFVGRFLRRSSIDELPQLWGVVTGELSLVGPRVLPAAHVAHFGAAAKELRRDVPPGLTGLWQVNHRSDSDLHLREIADGYYVQNWSIWLDLWILLRTVKVVLRGQGAY